MEFGPASSGHKNLPDLKTMGYHLENPQEMGYEDRDARPSGLGLPPGGGKLLVPHFAEFSQIVNYYTRTYRYTFDEALKHSHAYTVAIRNEPVVMEAIRARQMPTSLLSWHIEPENPENPEEEQNAKGLEQIIKKIPRFQQYRRCLLEGIFYGRYGVQNIFKWDFSSGTKNLVVRDWSPVNGDKLVFRYNGQVGVLVHATWDLPNTAITDRGRAYFLTPEEREALVVHEFEPEDSDFFEGQTAGAIHGVGIRGRIYWVYWLRAQILGALMEYLERVGAGGFTIYFYEAGNPSSLEEVKLAAENQLANNCILFPRYRTDPNGGPGVTRIEPSNAGVNLLIELVTKYLDNIIRRYILGPTISEIPAGIGSGGLADMVLDASTQRLKYDAIDLDETLTTQVVAILNKYNCPGNPCPRFVSEVDRPNAAEYIEGVKTYIELGGQADAEAIRKTLALPRPIPGREVLSMAGPMPYQPQAQAQPVQFKRKPLFTVGQGLNNHRKSFKK